MALSTPVSTFILDSRHVFTPYQKANLNDVMSQLNAHGVSGNDIWSLTGWANLENSMTIRTDKNSIAEKLDGLSVDLIHPVLGKQCFTIERKVEVPAEEKESKGEIRIVFKNCCIGELLHVRNEQFDISMKKIWGITLKYNTEMELRFNGSPTGNRFCVIEETDLERLSLKFDRFTVTNPEISRTYDIKVDFDGKVNVCRCCRDVHFKYCPHRNKYFQLKKQKENLVRNKAIKIQFFSDSQLRYVENIGLYANFTCSSGATIGQIANIIRDNPLNCFQNIVILMGANNIDETKSENLFRAQTTVEVRRLLHCLKQKRFDKAVLVPGLRNTEDVIKKHQMSILQEILENETLEEQAISIYSVNCDQIKFDAESEVHPSREGTFDFLLELSQHMKFENFFLDKQFAVTLPKKNIYTGVHSVYKFGCRFCETTYFVKDGCCDNCHKEERFENVNSKEFSWE